MSLARDKIKDAILLLGNDVRKWNDASIHEIAQAALDVKLEGVELVQPTGEFETLTVKLEEANARIAELEEANASLQAELDATSEESDDEGSEEEENEETTKKKKKRK